MQFITVASALFAAALAAPAPQTTDCPNPAHCGGAPDPSTYENIDISDYTLRKNDGIQSVYFKLSGTNGTGIVCQTGAVPTVPSEVVSCGESAYRFGVVADPNGGEETGLAIYHQTAPFVGKWGTGSVPTYCRAGGNGPNDFVCQQVNAVTITIT
ncbi:Nn.00g036470.m01.CDS01 [Neocucurbitaria sp. VM-36]